MNVSCSQCQTVFRVDPEKVPAAGVRARCSVCSGVFWVRRETPAPAPAPVVEPQVVAPAPAPAPVVSAPPAPPPAAAPAKPAFRMPAPAATPPSFTTAPTPQSPSAPLPGPAFNRTPARAPQPAPAQAPVAPPAAPAAPAARRPSAPVNPFLSQDPSARARRLARALVSDIVVYHPAKRRDGLRDGSLKLLFEEEIRKSWEEYIEQVGRELAESTSYFTDALNDILADGQPVFP